MICHICEVHRMVVFIDLVLHLREVYINQGTSCRKLMVHEGKVKVSILLFVYWISLMLLKLRHCFD